MTTMPEAPISFFKESKISHNKIKLRLKKNNIVYLFFFKGSITDDEMGFLKNVIINQDVMQSLPVTMDTILPIVYDTAKQKYIVKKLNKKERFIIRPIHIALRNFYKLIIQA